MPSLLSGWRTTKYRYFVEIDCATEHRTPDLGKAKTYLRYWQSGREQAETGIFPFVLWVAPDQRRAGFLVDTLSNAPARTLAAVHGDHRRGGAKQDRYRHRSADQQRKEVT